MKIDLDKFFGGKEEKTVYSKRLGFLTIYKKIQTNCRNVSFEQLQNDPHFGIHSQRIIKLADIEDIYAPVLISETIQNTYYGQRSLKKYQYNKVTFNEIEEKEILTLKNNGQHFQIEGDIFFKITSRTNSSLLTKVLIQNMPNSSDFRITLNDLKILLMSDDVVNDEINQLVEIININQLNPKVKVFIDTEKGGEGEIVGLKEFNSIERKAIYEVQLYDGTHIDVNWYDKTIKMLVPKSYKAPNELDILEETLSENKLNPFVRGISNGFNIYWQALEEAAYYTVELYTWNDASAADKLYKIADKTIERNQYYAVFDLLAEGKYFVRIIAEDRTGLKIAVNKAISVDVKKDTSTAVNNNRRGF